MSVAGCGWFLCRTCAAVGQCMAVCLRGCRSSRIKQQINLVQCWGLDGEGTQRHMQGDQITITNLR